MADDNKAAETSAAAVAEPEFNPADQYTWSPGQREHWNETGEAPEPPKKAGSESAATPAKEAKSEPEGKTAAESETASKQGKRERKPGEKLNAEERISQLTAKVRELEAERERSRTTETKPAAARTVEPPKAPEKPKRPRMSDFDTTDKYEAAMDSYETARDKYLKDQQAYDALQERIKNAPAEQAKIVNILSDTLTQKYGAEAKSIDVKATMDKLVKTIDEAPAFASFLNTAENFTDLLYVLATDPKLDEMLALAKSNPHKAVRWLVALENATSQELAKGKSESGSNGEPKSSAEPKPRAPKPPSEVGGRGAAADDELRVAAASGDFRAFEAEQNRRKFSRSN